MNFAREQKEIVTEVFRQREADEKLGKPVQESGLAAAGNVYGATSNGTVAPDVNSCSAMCKCTENVGAKCSTGEAQTDSSVASVESERDVSSGEAVTNAAKDDLDKRTEDATAGCATGEAQPQVAMLENESETGEAKGLDVLSSEVKKCGDGSGVGVTETKTTQDTQEKDVHSEKNGHNCCTENKAVAGREC